MWDVRVPDNLPTAICAIALRPFTPEERKRYLPGIDYRWTCPA
ncbi:hypothetical protein ABT340_20610 [Streptosporangium sp. NPDC000239]